jgi:hypothetical protein
MLEVAVDGVTVKVTFANLAPKGESFPFLPESEMLVNSTKEVLVVRAVPADVDPSEVPNWLYQVITAETVVATAVRLAYPEKTYLVFSFIGIPLVLTSKPAAGKDIVIAVVAAVTNFPTP